MTAADLTADRLDRIRTEAARGFAPTMRDTHALLAEVERLRADTVPRSALVQVGRRHPEGWVCTDDRWSWCRTKSCGDQPVYVIREDTDA